MKLLIALMFLAASANAVPYFDYFGEPATKGGKLDFSHPKLSLGSVIDPVNVGNSQQSGVLAVVYRKGKNTDGSNKGDYIIFPGEDWTLLGVGYAASGQSADLVLGPSWNVLPVIGDLAETIVPHNSLTPILTSQSKLNGSFGPAWVYSPTANKGYFRFFAGASWNF